MDTKKLPLAPQRVTMSFAFSYIERALQEGLANRLFGKLEMQQILRFFATEPPECVYCGSPDVTRWDHLMAVAKGGESVIGNMVPACSRCDDSKRALQFDIWMNSDAPGSPKSRGISDIHRRIEKINDYINHFSYQLCSLESRLNSDERAELERVRESLKSLRQECENLIASYRGRKSQAG